MEPKKKSFKKTGLIVCSVILAAALLYLAAGAVMRARGRRLNEQLQPSPTPNSGVTGFSSAVTEPQPSEEPEQAPIDFEAMQAKYPDLYAYIEIPGTNVSYPIFQHPDDAEFYLNHNADGEYDRPWGPCTIYTEPGTAKDFSDFNTIIYGHDMSDLTMFGTLQYFRDPQFLAENREIIIYTPTEKRVYTIFAAVVFDDRYLPYYYDQTTVDGRMNYLHDTTNVRDLNSQVLDDVAVTTDSHIITLSTCIDNQPNNRYLVEAVWNEE